MSMQTILQGSFYLQDGKRKSVTDTKVYAVTMLIAVRSLHAAAYGKLRTKGFQELFLVAIAIAET